MQALPDKTDWSRVHNVLVGTNAIACQSAALHAEELGFVSYILSTELSGEAKEVKYFLIIEKQNFHMRHLFC